MYLLCRVYVLYQFVNSYRNVLVFVGDLIREVRTASEDGRLAIACHRRTRARYCRVDHRNWINRYPCNGEQHTLRVVCGKKCRSGQWAERLAALLSQLDDCDCTMGTLRLTNGHLLSTNTLFTVGAVEADWEWAIFEGHASWHFAGCIVGALSGSELISTTTWLHHVKHYRVFY